MSTRGSSEPWSPAKILAEARRASDGRADASGRFWSARSWRCWITTIVNVALPSIGRGIQVGPSALEWVVSGYALTSGDRV
jgi:hypothetical protein